VTWVRQLVPTGRSALPVIGQVDLGALKRYADPRELLTVRKGTLTRRIVTASRNHLGAGPARRWAVPHTKKRPDLVVDGLAQQGRPVRGEPGGVC